MSRRASMQGFSSVDIDASSVFRLLVEEHRDALSGARTVLRRMRENAGVRDPEGLSKLERLFGLVKASSSYLGLAALRELVLEAERVVDRLQWPSTKVSPHALIMLEETLDYVAVELADARANERTAGHQERGVRLRKQLQACELTPVSMLPEQISDQELFADDAKKHIALCREAIVRAADETGQRVEAVHSAFRAMHTLKGNAAMMGFAEIEALSRAGESALEGLRSGDLTLTASLTVALLNLFEKAAAALARPHAFHWKREEEALELACTEARVMAHRTRIGALLIEHDYVSREQVELVLAIKREPLGQALILLHALSEQQLSHALDVQRKLRTGKELPSVLPVTPVPRNVQVDQVKFELLSRRMARLTRLLRDAPEESRLAARELEDAVRALDRVALRSPFRRVATLMRELAAKQHKRLELSVQGEELELERSAIGPVSDALVHLGRNAVDHGLEHEIERVAAGKHETARVVLKAWLEGGQLWIELADDGRGMNRAQILQKALAMGLIAPSAGHTLSDAEVHELVFAPGFSTRDKPTDVSGRGVGLDAVKHAVEALGGSVGIQSQLGRGTRIQICLPAAASDASPLSLAPSAPSDAAL